MAQEEGLHKDAFWLYGVIVGLAIREGLTTFVPHIFTTTWNHAWAYFSEGFRLLVFLIVIVRFYLGSAKFFNDFYIAPGADARFKHKNFTVDFLFGFVHFLVFFAWAASIDKFGGKAVYLYPGLLTFILLYDIFWFAWSTFKKYHTRRVIGLWAILNFGTFLLSCCTFLVLKFIFEVKPTAAEQGACVWVLFVSFLDISQVITRRRIFAEWINDIINDDVAPADDTPANPATRR
jgi:hypothetical protein